MRRVLIVLLHCLSTFFFSTIMAATKNTDSLSRILEHALRLKNQVVPPNRPHIERGLEQIESQSQQLLTRVTGEEDPFGTKT
jgi:uncharacterized protein with ATP-grasp and redox domains